MAYDIQEESRFVRYPEDELRRFSYACLQKMGILRAEVNILVDGVLTAALWWHPGQGQGIEKLPRWPTSRY